MNKKDFIIENGLLTAYIGKSEYIEVPDEVTAIAEFAFEGNNRIKSVIMPDSVLKIGTAAFSRCKNLKSVVLSDSLIVIETHLFNGCDNLTEVVLPKNLKNIQRLAFYHCESLSRMDLPDGVSYIGADAFHGCRSLESIELPKGLKRIGDRAFAFCANLQDVVISEEYFDMGCELFYEASPNIRIEFSGASDDFVNMIFSEERIPRPWEGHAVSHTPTAENKSRFGYDSAKAFCIEAFCKKDGVRLTFCNAEHSCLSPNP